MIASYTYGPLLGLFVFGLFTKRNPRDKYVPYICIASPLICLATDFLVKQYAGYTFGYEMLMVNGGITFAGLWLSAIENGKLKIAVGGVPPQSIREDTRIKELHQMPEYGIDAIFALL